MDHEHRTLLARAARAAGYDITWKEGHCKGGEYAGAFIGDKPWNPLGDDGDALRLAVTLEMDFFNSRISVGAIHRSRETGAAIRCRGKNPQLEPYAATRLAITRAAASMAGE